MASETLESFSKPNTDVLNDVTMVQNGKNVKEIRCERCGSIVLRTGQSHFIKKKSFLPHMKKKSETADPSEGETLEDFWVVDDMFTFENVGFSNTVDTIKYLICADCEIGPIGWHDINNKKEFFIAVDRVNHVLL